MTSNFETIQSPIDSIHTISLNVSEDLKQKYGPNAHKTSICYEAASRMVDALVDRGYDAIIAETNNDSGPQNFVVVELNGNKVIVDAAWKHFLPRNMRNNEAAPDILIGSVGRVVSLATNYGVSEEDAECWKKVSSTRATIKHREQSSHNPGSNQGANRRFKAMTRFTKRYSDDVMGTEDQA